jgi:hypothetical protein
VRQVAVWPDREVRHVHYTGHAYSSIDTSRSIERSGDFKLTFWLDSLYQSTQIHRLVPDAHARWTISLANEPTE